MSDLIKEFNEDLKKQCVMLVGLPAAGKTTFIKNQIDKYIPGISKGFNISNTDNQTLMLQYSTAKDHFTWLTSNVRSKNDILKFKFKTKYTFNNHIIEHPITFDWWENNKDSGIKNYYKEFYKSFYATYFDIRDSAIDIAKTLTTSKIRKSANIIVIDTVGSATDRLKSYLQDAKNENFTITVIYLKINPELCIRRDLFRKETQGRSVGDSVIRGYEEKLETTLNYWKSVAKSENLIDRILEFEWKQNGVSVVDGKYQLVSDNRVSLSKRIKK